MVGDECEFASLGEPRHALGHWSSLKRQGRAKKAGEDAEVRGSD